MLWPVADLLSSLLDESLIGFGLRGCYHIDDSRVYQIRVSRKFFQKLAAKRLVDNSFVLPTLFLVDGNNISFFSIRTDKFLFLNIFQKSGFSICFLIFKTSYRNKQCSVALKTQMVR